MGGIGLGSSFQFLIDANQNFTRSGHNVYFRTRNSQEQSSLQYAQLGFVASPSGVNYETGYTDTLISPPPSVYPVSVHNIGMSMGKLRFGAKVFNISDTFVSQQAAALGIIDDNYNLWTSQYTIGFFYENMLYSIEDIKRRVIAGKTIFWNVTANANEIR